MDNEQRSASRKRADNRVQEFVWAFGSESEEQIEKQIERQIEQLKKTGDVEDLLHGKWSHMEELDEDEWLEHLEEHLKEIVNISGKDEKRWQSISKHTEKKCMTVLPGNILNWQNASRSAGIYWMNT